MNCPRENKNARQPSFICLMYHNVPGDPRRFAGLGASITSYFVEKQRFASQMSELLAYGGRFLEIEQARSFFSASAKDEEFSWPQGCPILLSFDDGWEDSVEVAGPILEAHHGQAYLFITTQFIGRPFFVDRRQLQNLPKAQFRLGSHGQTHRLLSLLTEPEIRTELQDSKALLEDITGSTIDSLSVPGGAVDHRVRRIAREVGYRFLFTSEIHVNNRRTSPLAIGRLAIKHNTSSAALKRFVQQRISKEWVSRSLLGGPKRLLGLARYEKLRRYLLGQSQLYP
jgi:peptidoglycan/xylan/chitin deacetylase (PgdA/CDA1 family)